MESRRRIQYKKEIIPQMMKDFKYTNIFQVPKIEKIVLSLGFGPNNKEFKRLVDSLTDIACQKAVITKAKKSISQFSIRQGFNNGAMVTLRNNQMYHFLDRLFLALLSWKSFRGLNVKSINVTKKNTQISFGITDMTVFHGIKSVGVRTEGFNITIATNCRTKEELIYLLEKFDIPFRS